MVISSIEKIQQCRGGAQYRRDGQPDVQTRSAPQWAFLRAVMWRRGVRDLSADHQAKEQNGPKDRELGELQPRTADSWYLPGAPGSITGVKEKDHRFTCHRPLPSG